MLIFLTIFETPILIPDMTMPQYSFFSFRVVFLPLRILSSEQTPHSSSRSRGRYWLCWHLCKRSSNTTELFLAPVLPEAEHLPPPSSHPDVLSHPPSCFWTQHSLLGDRALKRSPSKGHVSMCAPIKVFAPKHGRGQHGHQKIRTRSYPAHILFSCLDRLVAWGSSSGWHGRSGAKSPCQLLVRHLNRHPYFGRSWISYGNHIPPSTGSCFSKPKLLVHLTHSSQTQLTHPLPSIHQMWLPSDGSSGCQPRFSSSMKYWHWKVLTRKPRL